MPVLPGAAAAALALLVTAVGVQAGTAPATACAALAALHNPNNRSLYLSDKGAERVLALHWHGGPPARAAAALLAAVLGPALGYRGLRLARRPSLLCELARAPAGAGVPLAVSAGWAGEPCAARAPLPRRPLAPALAVLAAPAAPRPRLLAARSPAPQNLVYVPTDIDDPPVERFRSCADVQVQRIKRAQLLHLLGQANSSFLFLDYDMWEDHGEVSRAPACGGPGACATPSGAGAALRVLHNSITLLAPLAARAAARLAPAPAHLRRVLELAESTRTIEEAACLWASDRDHTATFKSWIPPDERTLYVAVCYCSGDPDNEAYSKLVHIVGEEIERETRGWKIHYYDYYINCTDENEVRILIEQWANNANWYKLLGVVARGAAVLGAAETAGRMGLPLVKYGAAERGAGSLWAAAGGPAPLAAGLARLLVSCGWARLAVLSEDSRAARSLLAELAGQPGLALRARPATRAALRELRAAEARIFLVNAGPETAAAIVAEAHNMSMTAAHGFVWIVREWRCAGAPAPMRVYGVSLWGCADGADGAADGAVGARAAWRARRLWAAGARPARAAPLADALLTLVLGYRALLARYPLYTYDLHAYAVIGAFNNTLANSSIVGFNGGVLRYVKSALAEPVVFVEEASGSTTRRLHAWLVRDGAFLDGGAVGTCPLSPAPTDGAARCAVPAGDPFQPHCLTAWLAAAAVLVALAPPTLAGAVVALRRWLARRDRRVLRCVLARHSVAAPALAAHLVPRGALQLREELGAGRPGRVRLALLHAPGPAPRAAAAKALRPDAAPAEERELLREACALASLQHEHVVRLLGVCAADGPPLLLMEHAFFGDLLHYLRARRHLAEQARGGGGADDTEAAHVSAEALTRFAREAASALGFLAHRGWVHRDVRAANCLVDARRRLKLGDFAMARETTAAAAGPAEYACRRRALFPVLWMAPESLARGVFSAASDVWALGVLVFELVTLGARPFGSWSPLRVLHHVLDGGRPELPHDASPLTRGVALACWQRAATRRCDAATLQRFLAAHPGALRPALQPRAEPGPDPPSPEPTDADSGLGETPPADHG